MPDNSGLFLDELPEFHRITLEVLCQLPEDGWRTIKRLLLGKVR